MLFMFPYGIHTGAQADRLAVAISFFDNGMNFLKPATFSQYSKGGIIGVEFPIQAYVAAIMGKIFGRDQISFFFRLEDTLIACAGLFFLFLACYRRTKSFFISILCPLFIFCSPVYIGYTCNYLPDAAGASLAMAAFYFVLDFIDHERTKTFAIAIFLLTLAALIKTSVAIYLIGFIGFTCIERLVYWNKYNYKQTLALAGVSILSVGALVFSYLYIKYLNTTYEAWLFLSRASPFSGLEDFLYYINVSFKHLWLNEYLVLPQYLVLAAVVFSAIPSLLKKRAGVRQLLLGLYYCIGAMCVFLLMGNPMQGHDYYFVSIFIPFIAFIMLISSIELGSFQYSKEGARAINIAITAGATVMFFFGDFYHHQRQRPDYPGFSAYYRTYWMTNASEFMDKMKIPFKEKIVVLNEPEPNLSLLYFDRKGYVVEPGRWGKDIGFVQQLMKEKSLKYLVVEEKQRKELMSGSPGMFDNFELMAVQDQIALLKFKNASGPKD